jgi:ERCC4-related helicase
MLKLGVFGLSPSEPLIITGHCIKMTKTVMFVNRNVFQATPLVLQEEQKDELYNGDIWRSPL